MSDTLNSAFQKVRGQSFEDHGRCLGLVVYLMRAVGHNTPAFEDADPKNPIPLLDELHRLCDPVTTPERGDIILFRGTPPDLHAGVYWGFGKFAHVSHNGAQVERLRLSSYGRRVLGYYRMRSSA